MSGQQHATLSGRSLAQEADVQPGVASTSAAAPSAVYPAYRPPAWRPTCTHLTMTRMYDLDSSCVMCRRPGMYKKVSRDGSTDAHKIVNC
ncbi:hypothetical protein GGR57DRAFT_142225 [Xylariaceae sp. FL1272]|nr:hypothetical protein GGR57DRAFT_142225 [Xylariaceae sp. FL1272]